MDTNTIRRENPAWHSCPFVFISGYLEIAWCIAPVGGHTCLTAGERSEPAD